MKVFEFFRHNLRLIFTILAIVLGFVAGIVCRLFSPPSDTVQLVQFPGELFLCMLKMLVLPLIVSSIITGLGNITGSCARRICALSMVYTAGTSFVATLIGLTSVLTIQPGKYSKSSTNLLSQNDAMASAKDVVFDLLRNMVPDNIVAATIQHASTVLVKEERMESGASSSYMKEDSLMEVNSTNSSTVAKKTVIVDGTNILGVLTYCIVFGVMLSQLGHRGSAMTQFFTGINIVTLKMIELVMGLTAFLSSIGIASVSGVGLAMLMLVLQTDGLPDRGLALLVTIDWLLDRFSTTVNVASDCLVVGVVSRYTNLPPRDPSPAQRMLENDMV